MSATIGDFYERVSRAIRRGTVYDDDIPAYAGYAVRELENQQDWRYMENQFQLILTEGQVNESDFTRLKNLRNLEIVADGSRFIPLRKTRRENVLSIAALPDGGRPGAWWFLDYDAVTEITKIQYDAFPDQDYTLRGIEYSFSKRPLLNTLAWLTIGEDLLIARTIRKMQPLLRDDKLIARWQEIEQSSMPALLEAEVVATYDGADDPVSPFALEIEEDRAQEAEFS